MTILTGAFAGPFSVTAVASIAPDSSSQSVSTPSMLLPNPRNGQSNQTRGVMFSLCSRFLRLPSRPLPITQKVHQLRNGRCTSLCRVAVAHHWHRDVAVRYRPRLAWHQREWFDGQHDASGTPKTKRPTEPTADWQWIVFAPKGSDRN